MTYIRLNKDANNIEEVREYYTDRAKQLLFHNISWTKEILPFKDLGAYTFFYASYAKPMVSFYVFKDKRGQNAFKQFLNEWWEHKKYYMFITTESCNLEEHFIKHSIPHKIPNDFQENWPCYQIISKVYGNECAKRSNVPYMNHIDEGLYIMNKNGYSKEAMGAFCLHPIFQMDDYFNKYGLDIIKNYESYNISPKEIMFALEYRNIANAYLSFRNISSLDEINLSPISEVNEMLIADKIQNYKDFMLAHYKKHERSNELYQYFHNWFNKLGLPQEKIDETIEELKNIQVKI